MAVATEVSSAQLNPATQPARGMGGSIDANLLLLNADNGASGNGTGIPVEPGKIAEFFVYPTIGGDRTEILNFQISKDGGSTWVTYMTPRTLVAADSGLPLAWPVFIPFPTGTRTLTYVRVVKTLGGTTGTVVLTAGLRPFGNGVDMGLANV